MLPVAPANTPVEVDGTLPFCSHIPPRGAPDGRATALTMASSIRTTYRLFVGIGLTLVGFTGAAFGVALDAPVFVIAGLAALALGALLAIHAEFHRRTKRRW